MAALESLWVGEDGVFAFTRDDIEDLQQMNAEENRWRRIAEGQTD